MINDIINRFGVIACKYVDLDKQQLLINELTTILTDYDITKKVYDLSTIVDYVPDAVRYFGAYQTVSGKSPGTIKLYKSVYSTFFDLTKLKLEDVKTGHIIGYLQKYKNDRGVCNRTLETMRNAFNVFFDWCFKNGYIEVNPCENVQPIKFTKKLIPSLNQEELEGMREYCTSLRDRALIEFMYSTGCRVGELQKLNTSDVNFNTLTVELLGKGNKYRTDYMTPKAKMLLQKYIKSRTDTNKALFVTQKKPYNRLTVSGIEFIIKKLMNSYCECNTHVTPHVLRHTFAQTLHDRGARLEEIQLLLGHSNINTTQVYARTSKEDVRQAHKKYII